MKALNNTQNRNNFPLRNSQAFVPNILPSNENSQN